MSENPLGPAIDVFDGRTFSYVYENGWDFTNYFEGDLRISNVEGRGELRETVVVTHAGPDLCYIAWEDAEMGLISQVVDLANRTGQASVLIDGNVAIWPGTITAFD